MSFDALWKDRRRYFGLPISFTKYAMREDRLFVETGFFSIHEEEILLYRVRDICLHMNLWQRLFRVGTIHLETSDKTAPSIELKSVAHPREVKEQIHRQVEEMKIARRMRFGEILDGDVDDDFDNLDDVLH